MKQNGKIKIIFSTKETKNEMKIIPKPQTKTSAVDSSEDGVT